MTVAELIKKLEEMPRDASLLFDGCSIVECQCLYSQKLHSINIEYEVKTFDSARLVDDWRELA